MGIKAVTFDLWDTIVHDDSDESIRAAQGLRSKRDERRFLVWQALNNIKAINSEGVNLAYDVADAGLNLVWHENHINWTVEQRLKVVLNGLDRTLPDDEFATLVEQTGRMEVDISPKPIDGIAEALDDLARRYKLCIVSDAIVTPGSGLRKILGKYDLEKFFAGFVFSDEVGHSKPHRAMFDSACQQLDVKIDEIVHIGDRDHNDVKGPQALGAKAVLFVAARDADRAYTSADAICEHHRDLSAIIDQLAG